MQLSVFFLIGVIVSLRILYSLGSIVYRTYVRPEINLQKYGAGNTDTWAVVTGSSDGIGKAMALELAAQNFNLVLLSRTQSKLDEVAAAARKLNSKIKVKTLAFDFTVANTSDYAPIKALLEPLRVTVLVNNVGMSHKMPTNFMDEDDQCVTDMVNVNVLATMRMTRIVLPSMVANRCGLVATLGSFTGYVSCPMLSVYSATKAFVERWTVALRAEMQGTGVDVQTITPMYVTSNMSKIRKSSLFVPTEEQYACAAVRRGLGYAATDAVTSPYGPHAFMQYAILLFPATLISRFVYRLNRQTAKRALSKKSTTSSSTKPASSPVSTTC